MLFVVGCEAPAKKLAPEADTGASADTAVDTGIADTGDTTGGGDAVEDTTPDAADTAPDTGEPPANCDAQLGLLPSTDCGCGGQFICRDQAAAPECVGALPENACGGCGGIAVEIGAGCGFCGDGVWTCDPANPDQPTCVGETPQNSCGGCTTLSGMEGDSCSADGFFLCVNEEELACVGPGQNACGGFGTLGDALGGPCGECGAGRFVCDGTDAVRCEEAASPRNACGGCGTLPNRVGDDCGDCGGTWACDPGNEDGLVCSQTRNVCGSCGSPGSGALGEACTGGRLVCGADGQLSCESNDRNLCGGTAELSAEPGTDCGTCGGVSICAGLDRVVCIGSSPLNACGGCGFLPGFPGTFCGVDHTWECAADGSMACVRTTSSVVVSDTVGATTAVEDGQVSVPPGAVTEPIRITIRVRNGMMIPGYELTSPVLEFGPAGTEFAQPLEVQIISDDAPASDMVWSNRASEGGGYSEVAGATVDGDALVGDVSHFSLGFTGIPIPDTELCGDGLDNDGDALADCDDTDCAAVPGCSATAPEDCANGADDDADLFVDCDDSDCLGEPECGEVPVEVCGNGTDDDVDGMTDCADADCADDANCSGCATFFCPVRGQVCGIGPEGPVCYTPCAGDADCAAGEVCTALGCAPDTGADAGSDTGADGGGGGEGSCADFPCEPDQVCGIGPEGPVCYTPCAGDADCAAGEVCTALGCASGGVPDAGGDGGVDAGGDTGGGTTEEICEDGLDNDGNSWVDCEDGACSLICGGTAGCDNPSDIGLLSSPEAGAVFENCLGLAEPITRSACLRAGGFGFDCATCFSDFVSCGGTTPCLGGLNRCSGLNFRRPEDCTNGIDDNGDTLIDCADPNCSGLGECGAGTEAFCDNGLDDDGDGLPDCRDSDCGSYPGCGGESREECLNARDDDGDGLVDCADLEDCVFGSFRGCAVPLEDCANGADDDRNGSTDCADSVCATASSCLPPVERCADAVDNDSDGLVDCEDVSDCAAAVACGADPSGSCVAPFVIDGTGYFRGTMATDTDHTSASCGGAGAPDDIWTFVAPANGTWCVESFANADQYLYVRTDCVGGPEQDCRYGYFGSSVEFTATAGTTYFVTIDSYYSGFDYWLRSKPGSCSQRESACGDGSDNDADGAVDCADVDCGRDAACIELSCADDLDSDADGQTDCADSDCTTNPACFESACNDFEDNDTDSLADCNDPDCVGSAQCQEICDDGIDNDGDAIPDCFDVACRGSAACPQQTCAGIGTFAYDAGNGRSYAQAGTSMTPCAPSELCSITQPLTQLTVSGALVPTYVGVCAPELEAGATCGDPALGFCTGYSQQDVGACVTGTCRRQVYYGGDAGQVSGSRYDLFGNPIDYWFPAAQIATAGQTCGDAVGRYCGSGAGSCRSTDTLAPTNLAGVCVVTASYEGGCPAGTEFRYESVGATGRTGVCVQKVGDGAACDKARACDEVSNLVCGSDGFCRPATVGEACNSAQPLTANISGIGPDYFAVGRLDGGIATDESLNCSGTVGPEKVFIYTATTPVRLRIEAGSTDGLGPTIAWYARTGACGEIFNEVACSNAAQNPSPGTVDLLAGQTVYVIVDSSSRWENQSGGDYFGSEFYLTVSETPLFGAGDACSSGVCAAGLNCGGAGLCETASCGDGVRDAGEECDDANAVESDGCNACVREAFLEVEPNDDLASAAHVAAPLRLSGYSNYEYDFYCIAVGELGGKVTLQPEATGGACNLWINDVQRTCSAAGRVDFWTNESEVCFRASAANSAYVIDVSFEPNVALGEGEACSTIQSGGGRCAPIGGTPAVCKLTSPRLQRGTCQISVCGDGFTDVEIGEGCDDGNVIANDGCSATCTLETLAETEPNNGVLTARNLNGYRSVSGSIASTSDLDYYKITLSKRSHLEFEVESTAFGSYSQSLGVQLLSSTSVVLYDGRLDSYYGLSGARAGSSEDNSHYYGQVQQLAFLEPGTYSIRLSAAASTTGAYTLVIRDTPTSVAPLGAACDPATYQPCMDALACSITSHTCRTPACGDGNVTIGEACDDGNTATGDGCSTSCQLETYAADSISSVSQTVSQLNGGARFTFSDGSTAEAIGISGTYSGSPRRYIYLNVTEPTRLRTANVYPSYNYFRIWRFGAASDFSTQGTQVFYKGAATGSFPDWFRRGGEPLVNQYTCDALGADGECSVEGGGTDCSDCGARYATGAGSDGYGYDTYLAPGGYVVELQAYATERALWLFLGESPYERAARGLGSDR